MTDKEIINTADLEDRIQTTKKTVKSEQGNNEQGDMD